MRNIVLTAVAALSILAGALLPSQVSAKTYTCWFNPAICKAICGKTTCGAALKTKSSSSSQSSASMGATQRR